MKRILVECHHTLGDVIMTLPALVNLRKKYPKAQIDYMCGLKNEVEVLKHTGFVNQVFVYNVKENSWTELALLALHLRSKNYQLGISLGGSPRGLDILFLKLSGCHRIVAAKEAHAIWKNYEQVPVSDNVHRVERGVKILEAVTGLTEIQEVTLYPTEKMCTALCTRFALKRNAPMIGLVIGTGDFMYRNGKKIVQYNTKKWELKNFVELSERLLKKGYQVLVLGGKKELEDCRQQKIKFAPQIVNTLGKLSILESIAIMTFCALVVGADTGPMHGAAAAGVRTLTLFGATDAALIAPYGKKAYVLETGYTCCRCYTENNEKGRTCSPAKCMQAISVEQVYQKIEAVYKSIL